MSIVTSQLLQKLLSIIDDHGYITDKFSNNYVSENKCVREYLHNFNADKQQKNFTSCF